VKLSDFSKFGKPVKNLERIKGLLEKINNPQSVLKFVHIAGTNGKGSTLEMASQAAVYAGYKVGQFTSPFNIAFEDRIRINNKWIKSAKFEQILQSIEPFIVDFDYSQFEIIFTVALLYFLENNCDIVFLEAGIGGLLDCTNIVKNVLVSAITAISYDHCNILGESIEEIAEQKAGIIKQGSAVVTTYGNSDIILRILEKTAKEKKSPFYVSYKTDKFNIKMQGEHQKINAAIAEKICFLLCEQGFKISENDIKKSFETVQVPSRFEVISQKPLIIFDGAHNPDGMLCLCETLKKYSRKFTAIFGCQSSKDYKNMCKTLNDAVLSVILVDDFADNCVSANELKKYFNQSSEIFISNSKDALKLARSKSDNIVICGSLYFRSVII
jgi:dihydrofolate synthase/folylpolyglutamate synthase